MYTKSVILGIVFLFGLVLGEIDKHKRVKRGYYTEGQDGPELVEEMRTGEEVHFKSNAPPPQYYGYGPIQPGYLKFTWVFKAVDDCQLVVYFKEYEPGERNCEYQTIQLADEEVESNVCGHAALDGDFKSTGKYLYVKHILRPGIYPAYFSCHVKCLPRSTDGQYEVNPYGKPGHRHYYYKFGNGTANYTNQHGRYDYGNSTRNYTSYVHPNETSYYSQDEYQNYMSNYSGVGYPDVGHYQGYYDGSGSDGGYKYGYGGNDTQYSGYGNGTGNYTGGLNGYSGNSANNATSRAASDIEWIDEPEDADPPNFDWMEAEEKANDFVESGNFNEDQEDSPNYYEDANLEPFED